MRLRLVGIASLFFLCGAYGASAFSGAELLQACAEKADTAGDLTCNAYLRGFIQGMTVGIALKEQAKMAYCPPQKEAIQIAQGRLIAEKYFRSNPEKLHIDASLLLGLAFVEAFPCRTSN